MGSGKLAEIQGPYGPLIIPEQVVQQVLGGAARHGASLDFVVLDRATDTTASKSYIVKT